MTAGTLLALFGIFITCLTAIVGAAWLLANQIGALRAQMEIMLMSVADLKDSADEHHKLVERVARLEERMTSEEDRHE